MPLPAKDTILLGHGSGGKLSAELIRDVFLPALPNSVLDRLDDQAIANVNGQRLEQRPEGSLVGLSRQRLLHLRHRGDIATVPFFKAREHYSRRSAPLTMCN